LSLLGSDNIGIRALVLAGVIGGFFDDGRSPHEELQVIAVTIQLDLV